MEFGKEKGTGRENESETRFPECSVSEGKQLSDEVCAAQPNWTAADLSQFETRAHNITSLRRSLCLCLSVSLC